MGQPEGEQRGRELIEVEVLVVGCGPAGLTAALALAKQKVRVLAITKHARLSPTPRAHVTNQRTFEVFRDLGVEAEARALATGYDRMPQAQFLRTLTSPEFGRIWGLGQEATAKPISPCTLADLPQHLLEPVLLQAAISSGAEVRFRTELVSFTQDSERVLVEVLDKLSGDTCTIAAKYMIGADGGNSRVAKILDLPFEGPGEIGRSLNILFDCDLSQYVGDRPGPLFYLLRTASDEGGVGVGVLRCIKPWTSWMLIKGFEAGRTVPDVSVPEAVDVIRDYLGVRDLQPRVTGVDPWTMNSLYAIEYQKARVFCIGDAVHRQVPLNGLGSNTAVQDAFNLAWKIALVLKGTAAPALLDTFSAERVPVGKEAVAHATGALALYASLLEATGISAAPAHGNTLTPVEAELAAPTVEGRSRRAHLRTAVGNMVHEFQTRGLELNHLYRSSAVVANENDAEDLPMDDLEPWMTSCPGTHLPHAWVQKDGRQISTLDLVGSGQFTILTGVGGAPWVAAAKQAETTFGIGLSAVRIGPGCAVTDLLFEWEDRSEIEDDGCLLVRPDGFIAWRQKNLSSDAALSLVNVLGRVLGRE